MSGPNTPAKTPADELKEKDSATFYKLLDYIDRHKQELFEMLPANFNGSSRSLTREQLSIVKTAMICEEDEKIA